MGRPASIFGAVTYFMDVKSCENLKVVGQDHLTFHFVARLDLEYFHVSDGLYNGLMQNRTVRTQ